MNCRRSLFHILLALLLVACVSTSKLQLYTGNDAATVRLTGDPLLGIGNLTSHYGQDLIIDGRLVGPSPAEATVAPGKHWLQINWNVYDPNDTTVSLVPDGQVFLIIDTEPGKEYIVRGIAGRAPGSRVEVDFDLFGKGGEHVTFTKCTLDDQMHGKKGCGKFWGVYSR